MPVTIKQVAEAAGVHHTTVSRALRGNLRIPAVTRARIRKIAKKLGYHPDAMLSSLIAYRQQIHRKKYNATLAWVTNHPTREGWKKQDRIAPPYQGAVSAVYRDAAAARANELGYGLETFWMRDPTPKFNLSQILRARNITGLLLAPQPRARSHIRLDWACFSTIGLGFSLSYPALHTVGNNHADSMVKIMRELKARGYRRIGLCLFFDVDERVDNQYRYAYNFRSQHKKTSERIPYFWSRTLDASARKAFNTWFDRHRPDAVISCNWEVFLWLVQRGIGVPDEVGVALTSTAHPTAICSGVYEYPDQIGRLAVNQVVDMIQRGERGLPELPLRILVGGEWCDGQTVRPRHRLDGKLELRRQVHQRALKLLPVPPSAGFSPQILDRKKWAKLLLAETSV